MIIAKGLNFKHKGAEQNTLNDFNFSIAPGELACLTGQNGSGKSTLLAILAGVFSPDSGLLELKKESGPALRAALVPQNPDIYILGSLVEEDLTLALDPHDPNAIEYAMNMAERFELTPILKEAVHTLSYGQKKKLSLASALAAKPDLLLLDEPFSGLDYPAAMAMRAALAENKQQGITQIVSEHDLDLIADMADNFLLLRDGHLTAYGNGAKIFPLMEANGVRPPCWWFSGSNTPLWQKAK